MPYDPRAVANYILIVRQHFGYQTTQLELQKLLYFCHGLYLVRFNEALVEGYFEAWDHGPVHPLIYREFRDFGSMPISRRSSSTNLITGESKLIPPPAEQRAKTLIAETVLQLRNLTASQLRKKSHVNGGAWHSIKESAKVNLASQVRIPDSVIRERYHRHILPMGDLGELDDVIEDFPPEPNRPSEQRGTSND
ncbi:MAG: type II toxin-antitoxin system antitoxin SocA domain-containing protein [Pseudomonadota bacterium]